MEATTSLNIAAAVVDLSVNPKISLLSSERELVSSLGQGLTTTTQSSEPDKGTFPAPEGQKMMRKHFIL